MKVLVASTEVSPFAKTGGLADVCASLPAALSKIGQATSIVMPAFRSTRQFAQQTERLAIQLQIPIGSKTVSGGVLETRHPLDADVPVYLIQQNDYFDREFLYGEDGHDYGDNCERFVFFSRAVVELARELGPFDIIHCNDWQTGLVPAYLRTELKDDPQFQGTRSLLTIHNMAYQGQFWHWDMALTGIDWKYYNWTQMEFHGRLNFLKTGIVFADAVNTVSPQYAIEIQTDPLGCGLEGALRQRHDSLTGIINGVDYHVWNPQTDPHLVRRYCPDTWREGKATCKQALQEEMSLPIEPHVPLIGIVGRLAGQKGWDLLAEVMQLWMNEYEAQWVVLGTGEPQYHDLLTQLAQDHPECVSVTLDFCEATAHRIESASDIFVMPSRYEPCGLNQLYSLRYGAVPVVRRTGGLADTIFDPTPQNIEQGLANGFSFEAYHADALSDALAEACLTYQEKQGVWEQLVATGMKQDWSWERSARKYLELYQTIGKPAHS